MNRRNACVGICLNYSTVSTTKYVSSFAYGVLAHNLIVYARGSLHCARAHCVLCALKTLIHYTPTQWRAQIFVQIFNFTWNIFYNFLTFNHDLAAGRFIVSGNFSSIDIISNFRREASSPEHFERPSVYLSVIEVSSLERLLLPFPFYQHEYQKNVCSENPENPKFCHPK